MTKVRVIMHPDREYDVSQQELLDLQRQGLLVNTKVTPDVAGTNAVLEVTKEK